MNEDSMNKLTHDEAYDALRELFDVIGSDGAASIAWHIIDKEAEKVTSDISGDKQKTIAELTYVRMILDRLESDFKEEWDLANGGDEPTYRFE